MNTQIHAYRDLPAISAKLRSAFPEQATVGQLQTMPSNTRGTADPAGGADVSRSTLDPRREENTQYDRFARVLTRHNAPQKRKDWLDSAEPLLILMLVALIGAAVFIVADTYQPHMLIGGFFE
jgi:hypothetical protein